MIVELDKLREIPCKDWLMLFDEEDKLNVHEAFKNHGQQYDWLYLNSDYDLIAWEIENNCFEWEYYSGFLAEHCPQYLDKEKYNWEKHSCYVAKYCFYLLDPELYNWNRDSWAIAKHCCHLFNPELYNWKDDSYYVETFCPHLLYLKPERV